VRASPERIRARRADDNAASAISSGRSSVPRAGETDPVRSSRAAQLAELLVERTAAGSTTALHCHERLRDGRVELHPGMSLDLQQRGFVREARA